ncbi:MAG: EAL domain-containing protein [Burkholderiales bacterium]
MSPRQFRNPEFVGTVRDALAALVQLGTPLELDDFGTGYSSLAHLQNLPVAAIKLDRAFTREMESKESAQAVVRAAIDMAHALGKTVVAEGVESAGQLALLQRLGCDTIQGYHIGRPVPAEEFAVLLRSRAQTASVGRVGLEPTTKGL